MAGPGRQHGQAIGIAFGERRDAGGFGRVNVEVNCRRVIGIVFQHLLQQGHCKSRIELVVFRGIRMGHQPGVRRDDGYFLVVGIAIGQCSHGFCEAKVAILSAAAVLVA